MDQDGDKKQKDQNDPDEKTIKKNPPEKTKSEPNTATNQNLEGASQNTNPIMANDVLEEYECEIDSNQQLDQPITVKTGDKVEEIFFIFLSHEVLQEYPVIYQGVCLEDNFVLPNGAIVLSSETLNDNPRLHHAIILIPHERYDFPWLDLKEEKGELPPFPTAPVLGTNLELSNVPVPRLNKSVTFKEKINVYMQSAIQALKKFKA